MSLLIIMGAVMQTSRQVSSLQEGPRLQEKLAAGEQALTQSFRLGAVRPVKNQLMVRTGIFQKAGMPQS